MTAVTLLSLSFAVAVLVGRRLRRVSEWQDDPDEQWTQAEVDALWARLNEHGIFSTDEPE